MEDDIDIYGDLDNINNEETKDPELVKELKEKNAELEAKVEELTKEFNELRKYCNSLEANLSSLHKTARAEIERKDRMISDLRQQVDNAAFRRDNFRIPKRINQPVKFPPPPKEVSYYPETVKKEVNNTINREETTYASPLNDEAEDTEQIYQPEKVPVTLFGQRLRQRLQKEAEEEAEALKTSDETPPPEPKKPEDLDQENQYRLIPLTLKTSLEDSRKRASENPEETPKPPESNPRRQRDPSPIRNKKRKLEEDQSRREKSPNHRHKSPRRSEERRRLEHEEYCCPAKVINDRPTTRNRNNGSSRSRSRERREFRSDRRKDGRTSRSPPRRGETGKFGKNHRKIEERENLRSSNRLRGRDVSPVNRMDLRNRLGRRGSVVQRRNGRRELRGSRSDIRERIETVEDKKENRMSRKGAERSEDRERRKRSESREKRSETGKNENQVVEGVHENTMDALDFLEEGEIVDSPGAFIFIPNCHDDKAGEINHVESSVNKVDNKNVPDDNLDDSIKEEKIENIERFIMKMQKEEEGNGIAINEAVLSVNGKVEGADEQKTIMVKNEPVAYNSVLSKYVKKKRESTEKILDKAEINEVKSIDSVDKIDDCAAKNEAPKIANNNVTKNNVNTGNKIDIDDSEVKTEIIRAPETLDKIHDEPKIDSKKSEDVLEEKNDLKCVNAKEDNKNDELEVNGEARVEATKSEKPPKSPRKEVPELSKDLQKPETPQPSRMILQQIASPTKTHPKPVENPQKLEPKEKENTAKTSSSQPTRIIVVARRRKVKLTDSSTSMTVVMSAKNSAVKNQ